MSPADAIGLAPIALLLTGALLCLLLEAAGTPTGASKRGPRSHLAIVALLALGAAGLQVVVSWDDASVPRAALRGALVIDQVGLFAVGLLVCLGAVAVLSAVPTLRELGEERGEVYALVLVALVALSLLALAGDLLVFAAAALLATVSLAALASLERAAPHSAEAAAKLVTWSGLSLSLLGFGAALLYGAGGTTALAGVGGALDAAPLLAGVGLALVVIPVLAWLPAVPLHMARVDVTNGSLPFAGGLGAAGGLVAGSALALRLAAALASYPQIAPVVEDGLVTLTLLTLAVPALSALDQRRVSRMIAHLVVVQVGAVLPLLLLTLRGQAKGALPAGLLVLAAAALAAAGALGVVSFFERPGKEGGTWERWSGAGRRHPVFTIGFLWLLATVAGLPGTAGFAARLSVGEAAFVAEQPLLGVAVVVAPALAIAPVLRLAIFLFAKPPDRELDLAASGWRWFSLVLAVVAVTVLGVLSSAFLAATASVSFGLS